MCWCSLCRGSCIWNDAEWLGVGAIEYKHVLELFGGSVTNRERVIDNQLTACWPISCPDDLDLVIDENLAPTKVFDGSF